MPTLLKAQTSPHSSLATKMTLRDCTLFVQVPREFLSLPRSSIESDVTVHESELKTPQSGSSYNSERTHLESVEAYSPRPPRGIRIVIADLDEKSEEIRGEYWKSLEGQLIEGGYYLGNGKIDSAAEDCDLSDVVWTSDQVKWNGCEV